MSAGKRDTIVFSALGIDTDLDDPAASVRPAELATSSLVGATTAAPPGQ